MKARMVVPILTLIIAASSWPWAESNAAVVGNPSDVSIPAPADAAADHDGVYGRASSRHGLSQFSQYKHKDDMVAAVRPRLKPDYPCQNLHVRELDCPSR